jgi:hypothetical protein
MVKSRLNKLMVLSLNLLLSKGFSVSMASEHREQNQISDIYSEYCSKKDNITIA